MNQSTESGQELFGRVAQSFVSNFRRVMRVSGEDENGEPTSLTQQALAKRSGVGRSTVASYISGETDEKKSANPDLKTICQLANALHVSPAFLLMRSEDWSHLAQAISFFSEAVQDEKFRLLASELMALRASGPAVISAAGLSLAATLKLLDRKPAFVGGEFQERVESARKRIQTGILATSALPPFGELKQGLIPPLLSLCAILGAQV